MKKLYILSSGAGGTKYMTTEALEALNNSEAVVGYRNYVKELKELIGDKPLFMSGMTKEIQRCQIAIDYAKVAKILVSYPMVMSMFLGWLHS